MRKYALLGLFTTCAISPAFALHDLYGFYINPAISYNHLALDSIHMTMNNDNLDTQLTKDSATSNGLGYSLAAGYGLENLPIRLELELGSQQKVNYNANPFLAPNDTQQNFSSSVSSYHVMANAIFDFHLTDRITPYIKLGAGIARNQSKLTDTYPSQNLGQPGTVNQNVTTTRTNFAWQAGLGSAVKLDDNLYANGELSYADLGKVSWKNFYDPNRTGQNNYTMETKAFSSYQASVGLLWFFGGTRYTAPANRMA